MVLGRHENAIPENMTSKVQNVLDESLRTSFEKKTIDGPCSKPRSFIRQGWPCRKQPKKPTKPLGALRYRLSQKLSQPLRTLLKRRALRQSQNRRGSGTKDSSAVQEKGSTGLSPRGEVLRLSAVGALGNHGSRCGSFRSPIKC